MGLIQTYLGNTSFFPGIVGIGAVPNEQLTVAGNISATGAVLANGSITTDSYVYSNNYLGVWNGVPISGSKVSVEGIDIKSTSISTSGGNPGTKDFYLKATDNGTAVWDTIEDDEINFDNTYIDGDLTVVGDIIEYSGGGVVYSKTSVFTKSLASGANTLITFDKASFKTAKYVITLSNGSSTTASEVLVTHNGTDSEGTTYGIVDAQASSLLSAIDVSVTGLTIDLTITTTAGCTAIVHGTAHY